MLGLGGLPAILTAVGVVGCLVGAYNMGASHARAQCAAANAAAIEIGRNMENELTQEYGDIDRGFSDGDIRDRLRNPDATYFVSGGGGLPPGDGNRDATTANNRAGPGAD